MDYERAETTLRECEQQVNEYQLLAEQDAPQICDAARDGQAADK
jgi:hypothetical protein